MSGPGYLTVVIHDAAASTWSACARLKAAIAEVTDMPVTWLVVPRYHGKRPTRAFRAAMDDALATGDELALHGYYHLDTEPCDGAFARARRHWYTAGEGEFSSLSGPQAEARLRAGIDFFRSNGWPVSELGFVAPAWLLSRAADKAVQNGAFAYTSTVWEILDLRTTTRHFSPSLAYSTRSWWRRKVSCAYNPVVNAANRHGKLLRLELHPNDADDPAIKNSWQKILRNAMLRRIPLTTGQYVQQMRSGFSAGLTQSQG
jgi:uncharacterized protein